MRSVFKRKAIRKVKLLLHIIIFKSISMTLYKHYDITKMLGFFIYFLCIIFIIVNFIFFRIKRHGFTFISFHDTYLYKLNLQDNTLYMIYQYDVYLNRRTLVVAYQAKTMEMVNRAQGDRK